MSKDLTNSATHRQNILNNSFADEAIYIYHPTDSSLPFCASDLNALAFLIDHDIVVQNRDR